MSGGAGLRSRDGLTLALFALALLLPALGLLTVAAFGHRVTVIVERHDEARAREWRRLRDPRDDPAEIHGRPEPGPPRRVLVFPWDREVELGRLPEDPRRELLFVDRRPGIRLLAPRAVLAPSAALGLLSALLGVVRMRRRRRRGTV